MATEMRLYPVGIQTFQRIIEGQYIYVDKTDLMWKMTRISPYVFLSRPRRFGKSLLSSTLHSFFSGRKDLFEGLKVMDLEQEWTEYPVFHLDLSEAKNCNSTDELKDSLLSLLKPYIKLYGRDDDELLPGKLLKGLIRRAYEQTGRRVVVIVDEYDAPLLDVLHEDELLPLFRHVMQEFYQPLKASEAMVRFCFITGITKFSQLSIFSTINNLTNISLDSQFSAICGITEDEVGSLFAPDIQMLADHIGESFETTSQLLKNRYDGYHFSEFSPGIYNPYSLLCCFVHKKINDYWFATGTPTFLIRQMQRFHTDITTLDYIEAPASAFDRPTESMDDALPLLYQSGYLTIKDYDRESGIFSLAIPNKEVRVGFTEGVIPAYTGLKSADIQVGFALKFWRALKKGDIDLAMRELQAYMEGIPYVAGFKKKLAEVENAEGFYEYTLYLIFSMLNVYVRTQVRVRGGQIDMVVLMPDTTYVFELKKTGTAQEALTQIDDRGYSLKYQTEGRKVVKVGAVFDPQLRTLKEWVCWPRSH